MSEEKAMFADALQPLSDDTPVSRGGTGFTLRGRDYRKSMEKAQILVREHGWVEIPDAHVGAGYTNIGAQRFYSVVGAVTDPNTGAKLTVFRKTGTMHFTNCTLAEVETLVPDIQEGHRLGWQNG